MPPPTDPKPKWARSLSGLVSGICRLRVRQTSEAGRSWASALKHAPTWEGGGERGSALRGVSVHYLNNGFVKELEAAGFSRESTIHEIEPAVIRGKGAGVACPRDGRLGSAFVDTLEGGDEAGRADFMLSYTWGYTVATIADSLVAYCAKNGLDPRRTYVWICAMCINQHRVQESRAKGETVPFQVFSEEFSSRVKGIGHVLALMGPWHKPMYIERAWCIFELSIAINTRCQCEIIMPPSETESFADRLLEDASAIDAVWSLLHHVCIKRAKASVQDDYDNIMHFIEMGPGLLSFNRQVRHKLQEWLVETAEGSVRKLLGSSSSCKVASALVRVAGLLQGVDQPERARALLRDGLREVSGWQVSEDQRACLLNVLVAARGTAERICGDPEASLASLLSSRRAHEELGRTGTAAGAELLASLGATQVLQGDVAGALESFRSARRVYEELGILVSAKGAGLLYELSLAEASLGQAGAAARSHAAARGAHRAVGKAIMPSGFSFPLFPELTVPCDVHSEARQCVTMCERVCQYYRKAGILETVQGAFVLSVTGSLKASLLEFESARTLCSEAMDICERVERAQELFGGELLEFNSLLVRLCAAEGILECQYEKGCKLKMLEGMMGRVSRALRNTILDWDSHLLYSIGNMMRAYEKQERPLLGNTVHAGDGLSPPAAKAALAGA